MREPLTDFFRILYLKVIPKRDSKQGRIRWSRFITLPLTKVLGQRFSYSDHFTPKVPIFRPQLAQSTLIDSNCKFRSRGIVLWIFAFDFFNFFWSTLEGVGAKTVWASSLQCTFCMDTLYKKACTFYEAPPLFMLLIKESFQELGIKGAWSCRGSFIFYFFLTLLEVWKVVLQEREYGYF